MKMKVDALLPHYCPRGEKKNTTWRRTQGGALEREESLKADMFVKKGANFRSSEPGRACLQDACRTGCAEKKTGNREYPATAKGWILKQKMKGEQGHL